MATRKINPKNLCDKTSLRAVKDAMEALNGTWKLQILMSLSQGTKRFTEISKDVEGITDKMLSKELKDLEINFLVKRTVHDSFPPRVDYSNTVYTKSLYKLIFELKDWGINHRKKVIGK